MQSILHLKVIKDLKIDAQLSVCWIPRHSQQLKLKLSITILRSLSSWSQVDISLYFSNHNQSIPRFTFSEQKLAFIDLLIQTLEDDPNFTDTDIKDEVNTFKAAVYVHYI